MVWEALERLRVFSRTPIDPPTLSHVSILVMEAPYIGSRFPVLGLVPGDTPSFHLVEFQVFILPSQVLA
jgi:hypothetical protein